MNIGFYGATKTVTGSNFLVEGAGKKFLVDCGLYQGRTKDELKNLSEFDYDINQIDFILLTHAHIDHSGKIPKIYKEGYRNKVIATKATCELCTIMLPDSGHIQEMEAEWKNRKRVRKGEKEIEPIYTAEIATESLELFEGVNYDEMVNIDENISIRFKDAGHMLGSAIIEIWITEEGKTQKLVFTGDLGNNDIPLLSECSAIEDADYLIMESTYGNRQHIKNDEKAKLFVDIVADTLKQGGKVVIPSFAVGRTQEILYEINNLKEGIKDKSFKEKYEIIMHTPVFVDSPLATSATQIFKNNMELFDKKTQELIRRGDNPLEFPGLKFTKTTDESKELNLNQEPIIIISASGMCEAGRIRHHLKHNIWNAKNTILFVGYQAPGTLGRRIVDGEKNIKLFGEEVTVNARIEYIEGYSGHADQEGLINFVTKIVQKPKNIFLVHGEEDAQIELRKKLIEKNNLQIFIPEFGETYNLNNKGIVENINSKNIKNSNKEYLRLEVLQRLQTLREEVQDMEMLVKDNMLAQETKDEDVKKINAKIKNLESQIVNIIENK